jgi:hypothetical protein
MKSMVLLTNWTARDKIICKLVITGENLNNAINFIASQKIDNHIRKIRDEHQMEF